MAMNEICLYCTLVFFLACSGTPVANGVANESLQLEWAARELRRELHRSPAVYVGASNNVSLTGGVVLMLVTDVALPGSLSLAGVEPVAALVSQEFAIRCTSMTESSPLCFVVGGDGTGVQYGALHLIDAARVAGAPTAVPLVLTASGSPFIQKRGLKLNAPLDARTPSYCDCGDNAQANILTMWDPLFWSAYFDSMIRMRFNALSIWQDHPFPSLTRVPEFPHIGYDDVMRANFTTEQWRDFNARVCSAPNGNAGTSPEVLNNLVPLLNMTLDVKIDFWRNVTSSGAALGIDIRFITWSVLTALAGHGMPGDATNLTSAYTRAATRAFLETYPDVAGVGITAGENMTVSDPLKEAWLWDGTGLAMNDVATATPSRSLGLIHRVWQTELSDIISAFSGLSPGIDFDFAFKYCAARCYTVPNPQVRASSQMMMDVIQRATRFVLLLHACTLACFQPFLAPIGCLQIWANANISLPPNSSSRFFWTLRNDDVYQLRCVRVCKRGREA